MEGDSSGDLHNHIHERKINRRGEEENGINGGTLDPP
jgi:hypothetical protein